MNSNAGQSPALLIKIPTLNCVCSLTIWGLIGIEPNQYSFKTQGKLCAKILRLSHPAEVTRSSLESPQTMRAIPLPCVGVQRCTGQSLRPGNHAATKAILYVWRWVLDAIVYVTLYVQIPYAHVYCINSIYNQFNEMVLCSLSV